PPHGAAEGALNPRASPMRVAVASARGDCCCLSVHAIYQTRQDVRLLKPDPRKRTAGSDAGDIGDLPGAVGGDHGDQDAFGVEAVGGGRVAVLVDEDQEFDALGGGVDHTDGDHFGGDHGVVGVGGGAQGGGRVGVL